MQCDSCCNVQTSGLFSANVFRWFLVLYRFSVVLILIVCCLWWFQYSCGFCILMPEVVISIFMWILYLDAGSLTQYVDFPTHFHGHTLDLLLAPTKYIHLYSLCFIGDHKIVSCLVDFPSVANHQDKVVTFCQYHKIMLKYLRKT